MRKLLLGLIPLLISIPALAETLVATGQVFDKEGKEQKFSYERFQKAEGSKVFDRAVYKDMDGKELTIETMETDGGKLIKYEIEQKQLKQKAWIEVATDKVTFNLKKYRKKNYPKTEDLPNNFIVGLQIVPTIKKNWDKLMKGDELEIKLGVWHRQEAITFDLSKEKAEGNDFVVKMNPSSMFIRAVVDPIFFTFDKNTKNLTSYKGRTTPKVKKGKSYYDFDGLTKYQTVGAGPKASPMKKAEKKKSEKKKADKKPTKK